MKFLVGFVAFPLIMVVLFWVGSLVDKLRDWLWLRRQGYKFKWKAVVDKDTREGCLAMNEHPVYEDSDTISPYPTCENPEGCRCVLEKL